jgi:hypothetical protein
VLNSTPETIHSKIDIAISDATEQQLVSIDHEQEALVGEIVPKLKSVAAGHGAAETCTIVSKHNAAAPTVGVTGLTGEAGYHLDENRVISSSGQDISQQALNNERSEIVNVLVPPVERNQLGRLATPPSQFDDNSRVDNNSETKPKGRAASETAELLPTPPKERTQGISKVRGFDSHKIGNQVVDLKDDDTKIVHEAVLPGSGGCDSTKYRKHRTTLSNKKTTFTSKVPTRLVLQGFDNLFKIYYNQKLRISGVDINAATDQIEFIFNLSTLYGLPKASIENTRKRLADQFYKFEKALWKAVMDDPARWLFLSLFLRSPSIFTEAIIHMVGSRSHRAWKHPYEDLIPENVSLLIKTKIEELAQAKELIDAALLKITIEEDGVDVRQVRSGTGYDAYRYWQDWHCEQTVDALEARQDGQCIDAVKYQMMAQGDDTYLEQTATIKEYRIFLDSHGEPLSVNKEEVFVLHLKKMKDEAQTIVEPILNNYSKLDNLEEGMKYLTCTTVRKRDLPWVQGEMDPYYGP